MPSPADELKSVTQQLYDQNVELAVRNKTLGILRKLYEITMSSLNVAEVTQKIVDTLGSELGFPVVLLVLVDQPAKQLYPIAITRSPAVDKALSMIGKPFDQVTTPLVDETNLIVRSIVHNEKNVTGNFFDILTPHVDQKTADAIENAIDMKTVIVYPFAVSGAPLGALAIGLAKDIDDLSRTERDTLEEIIDVVAIAVDRAKLHESVEKANVELQQLDKVKDEFLSMASHELKSPMNAIKNYLWLAMKKGNESPQKLQEYLDTAYNATQRLIALVNDLLDVSRIESGRVSLKLESLDAGAICTEVMEIFQPQAAQKNLTLTSTIPTGLHITADDQKLREVISNFISNAIKYTPTGSVTLSATDEGQTVALLVTDTGTGIKPEDQQKIFQKFTRVNTSFKELATIEGTGLGLWIAKHFAEMMGGQVGLTSQVGKGSTFWVRFPKA